MKNGVLSQVRYNWTYTPLIHRSSNVRVNSCRCIDWDI